MRIRIGDFVLFNLARLRVINRHRIAVERAFQIATALPRPRAGSAVAGHRMAANHFFVRAVDHHIHLLSGRRPNAEGDAAVGQLRAVAQGFRRFGIGVIQDARRLHLGGGNQDPVLCGGNGDRFALQQLVNVGVVRQLKGRIAGKVREAHADLLADGSRRQFQIAVGKFAFAVGRHFTAVAVVEAHEGLILPARPQQRIFIDPVGFGQRDAKSGAEGVGAGVIDRAVTGNHRYRTIGEVAKRHPQVAIDQLIGAVTNDDVDTTALFVERNHPVRAIFIAAARRGADVIPVRYRRAQRVAGFVVP